MTAARTQFQGPFGRNRRERRKSTARKRSRIVFRKFNECVPDDRGLSVGDPAMSAQTCRSRHSHQVFADRGRGSPRAAGGIASSPRPARRFRGGRSRTVSGNSMGA
jgi:hypothetical protein